MLLLVMTDDIAAALIVLLLVLLQLLLHSLYTHCYATVQTNYQDPNKEEVWLFPTSGEADRKFLVRCSFDDPQDKRARERVFVLLELTCTIRTERAGATEDDDR
jgi:hypothetical protein